MVRLYHGSVDCGRVYFSNLQPVIIVFEGRYLEIPLTNKNYFLSQDSRIFRQSVEDKGSAARSFENAHRTLPSPVFGGEHQAAQSGRTGSQKKPKSGCVDDILFVWRGSMGYVADFDLIFA